MQFSTPELPYPYDGLEPHIDEQTMRIHHDKHHVGYTSKLNAALDGSRFAQTSIEELLNDLPALPETIRGSVQNNGGGHYNHCLFWEIMSPKGGGEPSGPVGEAIKKDFGSFANFKQQFSTVAATRFGSGWAWLVLNTSGTLTVMSTPNQDTPLSDGLNPILGLDVWEHAYYLKYQNRRPEYVENFFNVINWDMVSKKYSALM